MFKICPVIWKRRAASDIILIAAGITVVFILPLFKSFPSGCLVHKLTGLYCAGCGFSRGVHSLLRWNLSEAAHYNLLLVTMIPMSGLWLIMRFYQLKSSESIKKYDKAVIIVFIVIVLLFMVLRNIPSPYFNFIRPD